MFHARRDPGPDSFGTVAETGEIGDADPDGGRPNDRYDDPGRGRVRRVGEAKLGDVSSSGR